MAFALAMAIRRLCINVRDAAKCARTHPSALRQLCGAGVPPASLIHIILCNRDGRTTSLREHCGEPILRPSGARSPVVYTCSESPVKACGQDSERRARFANSPGPLRAAAGHGTLEPTKSDIAAATGTLQPVFATQNTGGHDARGTRERFSGCPKTLEE